MGLAAELYIAYLETPAWMLDAQKKKNVTQKFSISFLLCVSTSYLMK